MISFPRFRLALFLSVLVCSALAADDGAGHYNPKLGSFTLTDNEYIVMDREVVDIWLDRVTVVFTFRNSSTSPQTATIGFPVIGYPGYDSFPGAEYPEPSAFTDADLAAIERYYGFTSTVNGTALPRKASRAAPGSRIDGEAGTAYFIADLSFRAGETLTLENSYRQYCDTGMDSGGGQSWSIEYIFTTGNSWAGPIGEAVVRCHLPMDGSELFDFSTGTRRVENRTYSFESGKPGAGGELEWTFTDWIPERNLEVFSYTHEQTYGEFPDIARLLAGAGLLPVEALRDLSWKYRVYREESAEPLDPTSWRPSTGEAEFRRAIDECYREWFVPYIEQGMAIDDRGRIYAQYLINAIYALNGYQFKKLEWKAIFNCYSWFHAPRAWNPKFSPEDQAIVDALMKLRG